MQYLRQQSIPDYVLQSLLMRQGGFGVYTGLLDSEWQTAMLHEATRLMSGAQENVVAAGNSEEERGGTPLRSYLSAPAGPVLDTFYHAQEVNAFLQQVTGLPVYASGMQGSYSYYARPGDYLGLHRDVVACDLAVITCLHDSQPVSDTGGTLCLYPSRYSESLSAIRTTPREGIVPVRIDEGHTAVMYGGIVPHLVTPMAKEQIRVISVLCYRV